jgi:hypothetical protein
MLRRVGPSECDNGCAADAARASRAERLDALVPGERRAVSSIRGMFGHASAAMTLDVYSGLFDDDLDAA